jgi:hypothetical protein
MAGLQVLTGALRGVLAAERAAAGSGLATAVRGLATSVDDKKITVEVAAIQGQDVACPPNPECPGSACWLLQAVAKDVDAASHRYLAEFNYKDSLLI